MELSKLRRIALAGTSLTLVLLSAPAFAADQDATAKKNDRSEGLADITVTARRVNENLQSVPTSIGALNEEELANRQIASLSDLKGAVANLSVVKTTVAGGNFLSIRGKTGIAIPNVSVDSSVGFLVDGIYYGRPQSAGGEVADIERIEVLRGPQGTLFGRNSSAGAINFITRRPSGEFGMEGDFAYGNYDRKRARISVDSPTFGGGFAARFTFLHEDSDGYVVNTRPGSTYDFAPPWRDIVSADRFGGANVESLMFKLRYDDGGPFTAEYKYDWTNRDETPLPMQALGFAPGLASWLATSPVSPFGTGTLGLYQLQRPGDVATSLTRLGGLPADSTATSEIKVQGHMLTLGLEVDPHTQLKSINAYRKLNTFAGNEIDGGAWTLPVSATARIPVCMACSETISRQWQISSELQLIGDYDRFSYILGAYYFRERGVSDLPLLNFFPILTSPIVIPTSGPSDAFASGQREIAYNTSYAAYAHVEYKLLETLNFAAGLRYSHDKREMYDNRNPLPAGSPYYSTVSFSKPTWDAALTYTATPDVNFYAKVATGYQSGGIVRGSVFKPETNTTFEVGMKSEWFDRHVRFNAALFHTKYKDVQIAGFNTILGLYAQNSGTLVTEGGEVELTVIPVDGLTLNANIGYSSYDNSTGLRRQAPGTSVSFSAQYDAPKFGNGSYISARVDGDYRGTYYSAGALLSTSQLADPSFPLPSYVWQGAGYSSEQAYFDDVFKASHLGDYALINARLSLVDIPVGSARVRASAYVNNIFNEDAPLFGSNNGIFLMASFERPRTYGVEMSFSF